MPEARVVKAFTIYGFENFENSAYPQYNVKPVMMFCGQDADAKKAVAGLIDQLGREPLDVGGLEQALHLEHMTLLWVRMLIRVRSDGHRYAFNLRTDFEIMAGSYQERFETEKDEWLEIALPFRDFVATSFGQVMRDAPRLNTGKVRSFGFTISDKQAGPFKLEVKWIKAKK